MESIFLILFFVSFAGLIVGLVKPLLFSRFIKGELTRKRIAKIFGIATILSFILIGITADTPEDNSAIQQSVTESEEVGIDNKSDSVYGDNESVPTETGDEPTPVAPSTVIQDKQADNQTAPAMPSESVGQKNAVKKAKSYLAYTAFSNDGLVAQLEYDQFSHSDAVYGADNSGADWNEQAAKKAKSYMEYSAFSRGSLIDQLKYDKFTQAEAEYGAAAVGF